MEILCVEPGDRNGSVYRVVVAFSGEEYLALTGTRHGQVPRTGQKVDIVPALEALHRLQKAKHELGQFIWELESQTRAAKLVKDTAAAMCERLSEPKADETSET